MIVDIFCHHISKRVGEIINKCKNLATHVWRMLDFVKKREYNFLQMRDRVVTMLSQTTHPGEWR